MKLKTRIRIAMITMLVTVVVLNTAIILFYISGSLMKNAEQSIQSINQQKMITLENLLDTFVTLTQKPLIDDEILSIMKKDYTQYPEESRRFYMYQDIDAINKRLYTEMFYKNEYIYAVTLITKGEQHIYSKQHSGRGVLDVNIKEAKWYQELYETDGTEAVLFPYAKEDLYLGEEPIIALGRLLKNPLTNEAIGVIRVDIAVKDLEHVWGDNNHEENGEVLVRDKNNNLLYTSLNVEEWESEYEKGLKTHLYITDYSEKYGVSFTSLFPKAQVYQEAYNTIFMILGIAVGCIVIVLILTTFTIKRSLKPIEELNGLMKEVRAGDLSVRANVKSVGDFEEVCESFNLMVENTEHLIDRVRMEEAEKREVEFEKLQAQISPHFIMNTINTIKWMAVIQGNKSIEKSLDSFANLLGFVIRDKQEKIPIQIELEQMRYYIDILSLRYYNKFNVEFQIEDGVEHLYTIKFLLQTIVENSVFHGFDEMSQKGSVQVRIFRKDNEVIYEVEDNGKGISEKRIQEILAHESVRRKGVVNIGIYNINRRIKLIFGEQYGISINSKLGEYTIVKVVIPAQEVSDEKDNNS